MAEELKYDISTDINGCDDELRKLLEVWSESIKFHLSIDPSPVILIFPNDNGKTLVFCGDVGAKELNSLGILESIVKPLAKIRKARYIAEHHDAEQLDDDDIKWFLRSLPPHIIQGKGKLVVVHATWRPDVESMLLASIAINLK